MPHDVPAGQLGLPLAKGRGRHGGRRAGAGRKPTGKARGLPHRRRPFHDSHHPVHVTMRVRKGLRSIRRDKLSKAVFAAFRRLVAHGPRSGTFRVVHFSIQPNHVHLVVEAGSQRSLGRGLQGLASSIARRLNNKLGRRGRLFADRYHARPLATPLEVRRAVAYVLTNAAHHGEDFPDREAIVEDGIDPCSSAAWSDVWARPPPRPPDDEPAPVTAPATWLLAKGWRRHGRLRRDEGPAS